MLKLNAQLLNTLVIKNNITSVKYLVLAIFGVTVPHFEYVKKPYVATKTNCDKVIKLPLPGTLLKPNFPFLNNPYYR